MSDPLSVFARAESEDEALVDATGALSYAALASLVRARIEHFRDAGAAAGSTIALVGEATRERVIDTLAAIELGAPVAMIHPRATAPERRDSIERASPRLVVDADGSITARSRTAAEAAPPGALAIVHTSGTSGVPKAAVLSRAAFVAAARASATRLPLGAGDRWLLVMPIAHVGGLSIVVRALIAGASVAVSAPFDAARTLEALRSLRPTYASLVPTMLARLLDEGLDEATSPRAFLVGGASCPEKLLARAAERRVPIRTTYGLTEACSQVTTASRDVRGPEDGSGEPLPSVEVRIGDGGSVFVRGPTLFSGYRGAPPPFDAEGWFDTGDIGRFDDAGRLHLLARRRDLIVTGGENVYPAEVEAALERVEGVEAACVFGRLDDRWGERVVGAVVSSRPGLTARGIVEQLRPWLAPYKLPKEIHFVGSLETNAAGKLDREATARRVAGERAGSAGRGALLGRDERRDPQVQRVEREEPGERDE